ncbi:serine protease Do [Halobacillus karajensis]|uniref:Serine protease Do-like HtrA n=1 Tax=Halobacillus karajensis TaxID=195088 RepID=A0A059NXH6_9BACI|nr:trypsin-like peptidase domain-containing protein [Halobacillus karajensis]CDQ18443.1 Serine protease Do-like HtrA [Halobacillus karajensis]CDQ23485.1 Serine protease Do-like HtrA [Halobacillus karajensis]CDQ26967.1 Serine protease Do-like HtrA [Halobacillus karajensis]SEH51334.1 serine protease Do [Halobacillus karajensis]
MGYYDDHSPTRQHKQQRRRWVMPTIVGGVLGAVLVLLALPALVQTELLPYDMTIPEDESGLVQDDQGLTGDKTKKVQLDVNTQITDVVEKVTPSVVGVVNLQTRQDFWQREGDSSQQAGVGSGVIYKKEDGTAYVVTNNHVIEGASEIEVVLADETRIKAELVGGDLFTDLAVLKMPADEVEHVAELGTTENLKVGEPAIAIGNPLGLSFAGSVTQGVISGKERAIPQDFNGDGLDDWQAEVIQTDAAINPGNSGGALINIEGQLIGINSMKIAQSSVEGIGFAIPIDSAKPIINELEEFGQVNRPYIGVEAYGLNEVPTSEWSNTLNLPEEVEGGLYIRSLRQMSPAAKAGLEPLDVITALDGEPVQDIIDLRKYLYNEKDPGDEMEVTYYRDGEKNTTTLTLGSQE